MDRQREYEKRLQVMGYKRVTLWVPAEKVDRLKKYAETLRREKTKK